MQRVVGAGSKRSQNKRDRYVLSFFREKNIRPCPVVSFPEHDQPLHIHTLVCSSRDFLDSGVKPACIPCVG
jgi:hypothetical protein